MEHVVLGLHGLSHESGACVLTPEGAWALSEERLSRRKYDGGLPALSAPWALRAAGLAGWSDVDLVVVDLLGGSHERLSAWVREQGYEGPLATCSHHDAHAASAWFPSPFDEAAVLVVDAGGSKVREIGDAAGTPPAGIPSHRWPHFCEVQTAYLADRDGLAPLRRSYAGPPWGVNPGVLYGMSALFLGFGPMGAGKLMGLAPFGHPPAHLPPAFFSDTEHGPLAHCEDWPLRKELLNGHYRDLYGVAPRAEDGPLEGVHEDIASWVQEQASAAVLSHVRRIVAETGRRRLCLAGGFGLNAVTNRRILEETPVEELYVQPAATDAGAPLGCALWGAHVVLGAPRSPLRPPVALGGDYAAEVEAALRSRGGLRVHHCADIASETARAIADGAIVGWFQGRSEYGPRALGHRSLLADPRSERSVECLNRQIKLRESFRPYAPAVLEEFAPTCFDLPVARSPYMLLICQVRESWRARLPAITHVDGSARVQTVSADDEPRFAALLAAFGEISGVPVLLNTSFNRRGEPIVERPDDALDMLEQSGLDALALEDWWVEKATPGENNPG